MYHTIVEVTVGDPVEELRREIIETGGLLGEKQLAVTTVVRKVKPVVEKAKPKKVSKERFGIFDCCVL